MSAIGEAKKCPHCNGSGVCSVKGDWQTCKICMTKGGGICRICKGKGSNWIGPSSIDNRNQYTRQSIYRYIQAYTSIKL